LLHLEPLVLRGRGSLLRDLHHWWPLRLAMARVTPKITMIVPSQTRPMSGLVENVQHKLGRLARSGRRPRVEAPAARPRPPRRRYGRGEGEPPLPGTRPGSPSSRRDCSRNRGTLRSPRRPGSTLKTTPKSILAGGRGRSLKSKPESDPVVPGRPDAPPCEGWRCGRCPAPGADHLDQTMPRSASMPRSAARRPRGPDVRRDGPVAAPRVR